MMWSWVVDGISLVGDEALTEVDLASILLASLQSTLKKYPESWGGGGGGGGLPCFPSTVKVRI